MLSFEPSHLLDKKRLRRSFDRAARSYDEAAALQQEVGRRLLERLDYVRLQPQLVLDAGAGTGVTTVRLSKRYRKARVVALDLAHAMLTTARRRAPWFRKLDFVSGDVERLPLADGCCDLVFSNLMLQWCNDLDAVFAEFRRVLRPGGLLMFTTLGPDTLMELRQCWASVDEHSHVSPFIDMHDVGDALVRASLADPVMDMEHLSLTYTEVRTLMHDLKAIGAVNATAARPRGLTGKKRMQAMIRAYEGYRLDGLLPATYEVVYGHAWAPLPKQAPRSVEVPLAPQRRRVTTEQGSGER